MSDLGIGGRVMGRQLSLVMMGPWVYYSGIGLDKRTGLEQQGPSQVMSAVQPQAVWVGVGLTAWTWSSD